VLLGKKNVHVERTGAYAEEVAKLADYAQACIHGAPAAPNSAAAAW
jgi:hypothetical protein